MHFKSHKFYIFIPKRQSDWVIKPPTTKSLGIEN